MEGTVVTARPIRLPPGVGNLGVDLSNRGDHAVS
jgi:hypothetical protein